MHLLKGALRFRKIFFIFFLMLIVLKISHRNAFFWIIKIVQNIQDDVMFETV